MPAIRGRGGNGRGGWGEAERSGAMDSPLVDVGGGLVHDEDLVAAQDGARQAHELALARAQVAPALRHGRVQPHGRQQRHLPHARATLVTVAARRAVLCRHSINHEWKHCPGWFRDSIAVPALPLTENRLNGLAAGVVHRPTHRLFCRRSIFRYQERSKHGLWHFRQIFSKFSNWI